MAFQCRHENEAAHGADVSQSRSLSSLYEQIGGMPACRRLSESFHARIADDPLLRTLFPGDLAPTTEYLALFLAERFGGPRDYTARRGKNSLLCRHAHLPIGAPEAERWLAHMLATMEAIGIAEGAQPLLRTFFQETAATLSDPLLPLYHLPLEELKKLVHDDPSIATAGDHGRTLLRMAAREWDVPRVELLLEFGADVHARDPLGHDPLYHAASAMAKGQEGNGRAVVALLIQYGADVHGRSGPGRLTALHAAARRGTVPIAETLLASGADVDATDARGETPLRRAVNCGQVGMVRLLLAAGADPLSRDRQGRTPSSAARKDEIGDALERAIRSQGRE